MRGMPRHQSNETIIRATFWLAASGPVTRKRVRPRHIKTNEVGFIYVHNLRDPDPSAALHTR